ncbi:dynamin family protein [Rhodovulum euryhalinum]|uniref:Dynamin family protein n=1 Tax=Rhodovulum euryhalinum TaxID=35805 RepID=A0A4R2L4F7_9RHOB|nr:dynamin family protein [Rhodovulum euryhalinum]TCO74015.1 dynamin family protein [Rhodovulum euryhalinum]
MTLDDRAAPAIEAARPRTANPGLLALGMDGFAGFVDRMDQMRRALADLGELGDATVAKGAGRLSAQLDLVEPSITFIGQVKAGKTSLINAMTGWPGLLPADVNPWTSVVTSIHLAPSWATAAAGASFRFFDPQEWDRLIEKGGRMGELASRAGAEEELEKVRRQIERMREKSKGRLGRRFELLLGQEHRYGVFDEALVERYVCLGDDLDDDEGEPFDMRGRFADITKSADLFVDHANVPFKLCLRDTPGVNDTFLMREQITIGAIRDSRLCVLVLSAHQALSTVDMALIRLISAVKAREAVIFVNRIDELSDPASQTAEIRDSIRATLKKHEGPADAPILFGSAFWGQHALEGPLAGMTEASRRALVMLAGNETPTAEDAWTLSGIPALYRVLGERVAEGVGGEAIDRIARSVGNLARGVTAAQRSIGLAVTGGHAVQVDTARITRDLAQIEQRATAALETAFAAQHEAFCVRLDRSHHNFLDRATAALIEHLEKYGEGTVWSYEPTGLRILLRSACQVFGKRMQGDARAILDATAAEVAASYRAAFGLNEALAIEPPAPPRLNPPVAIAQTIALDVKGTWWRRWWLRRRGYRSFAAEFYKMIREETSPILDELSRDHAQTIRADLLRTLATFLDEQREIVTALAEKTAPTAEDLGVALGYQERADRLRQIESAVATMRQEAA